jgi:cysteinyl-tRNA synthetase
MTDLRHDDRDGKEESSRIVPGEIKMYSCGVTLYDLIPRRPRANADGLRRHHALSAASRGYRVTFVRNFTDIDDKTSDAPTRRGRRPPRSPSATSAAFDEDMAALGVLPTDVAAEGHRVRPEMIALIERLCRPWLRLRVDGDVYFEVRRFPRLRQARRARNSTSCRPAPRVEVDERKR